MAPTIVRMRMRSVANSSRRLKLPQLSNPLFPTCHYYKHHALPLSDPTFSISSSSRHKRFLHVPASNKPEFDNQVFTIASLTDHVNEQILSKPETSKVPADVTIAALKACEQILTASPSQSPNRALLESTDTDEAIAKLVLDILRHPATRLDHEILRAYFLLRPDTRRSAQAMRIFYDLHPTKHISKDVYMIPFRKALYEEDTERAIELVDLSSNSPQWYQYLSRCWKQAAGIWTLSVAGLMHGSDFLIKSDWIVDGGLQHTGSIKVMVAAYLFNSTMLALVALSSRPGDNGGRVLWQNGVFQNKWYMHAQESRMLSQIADMDLIKVENQGDFSPLLLHELNLRQRRLGDNDQDNLIKEYWAKQGQGFEWAEPDIDPAEEAKLARDEAKIKKLGLEDPRPKLAIESGDVNAEWIERILKTG
ncbi:hypothetical protein V1514DRAFT_326073 [Lipomyces japonicus]|uniref:uncharacterized protein n=1 Tax=Lipomyces japonicus TaxID=56871 RepID=UPI0034CD46CB